MRKLKSKVEICKLPSTTLILLPRYREARKLSPSPRWSTSHLIMFLLQRPVACWHLPLSRTAHRTRPVLTKGASGHLWHACFFTVLRPVWFPSSCLDYVWYLGSSLVLLESCLWCWSWDHHVAFVQVTSCTLLNYKIITCKFISPIWLCWPSNTKIQSKWA